MRQYILTNYFAEFVRRHMRSKLGIAGEEELALLIGGYDCSITKEQFVAALDEPSEMDIELLAVLEELFELTNEETHAMVRAVVADVREQLRRLHSRRPPS